MSVTLMHTDVRNDEGQSLLDRALDGLFGVAGSMDIALYLINCGCGDDEDKDKLLCGACSRPSSTCYGRLDVVKELVEKHHRDPKGGYMVCTLSMCV